MSLRISQSAIAQTDELSELYRILYLAFHSLLVLNFNDFLVIFGDLRLEI